MKSISKLVVDSKEKCAWAILGECSGFYFCILRVFFCRVNMAYKYGNLCGENNLVNGQKQLGVILNPS